MVTSSMVVCSESKAEDASESISHPMVKLICCADSHQFEERLLILRRPEKIGRTVVRAHPDRHNGIFDCKVLSRNHALIWFDESNRNFFIQDTKSSNGTFINGERLSKASEESEPKLIYSGDILQFGVEVLEAMNSHKVTHGSIIAKIELILPNGEEPPTMEDDRTSLSKLYELNQHIQEALAREQLLETKLDIFQSILEQTETASSETWQALIDEDRLISRIEILERQLATCTLDSEDKLKEELRWYLEEKETYQQTAKVTLKKLVDEKLEAVKSVKDLRSMLIHTQDEFATLKQLYNKDLMENRRLTRQVVHLNSELVSLKKNNSPPSVVSVEHKEVITDPIEEVVETASNQRLKFEEAQKLAEDQREEISRLTEKLGQMESLLSGLKVDTLSGEEEDSSCLNSPDSSLSAAESPPHHPIKLKELMNSERNLIQAEKKIAKLILVKEKYINLAGEKKLVEEDNSSLKKKLEMLTSQSQTSMAFFTFSLGILILAIAIAFLPYLSHYLFG